MERHKIFLFGPPRVEVDGQPARVERRKATAVLAYLSVAKLPVSREALATLLWPDSDRETGLAGLRRVLTAIRKLLGSDCFAGDRKVVELLKGHEIWIDTVEFERSTASLPEKKTTGITEETLMKIRRAAELYKGEFLEGFQISDNLEFSEWQYIQSQRFLIEVQEAIEILTESYLAMDRFDSAIGSAQDWLGLDAFSEKAHRALMVSLARAGRRSEAIRHYDRCVEILENELQVAPEPETVLLFRRIKEGEIGALTTPRIEVFDRQPVKLQAKLPEYLTPFVGREKELQAIESRLSDPSSRIVTLVGPGGIGKTRLASEVAARTIDLFADGCFFVPLAEITDARLILPTVADVLELSIDSRSDLVLQLSTSLAGKRLLIVLDNLEQLTEGVQSVADLVEKVQGLKVLATSRERLRLRGEWVLHLPGLELAASYELDEVQHYSSVKLFCDTAVRSTAGFELTERNVHPVVDICRLVSGIPLGIELAAAWVRVLNCEDIKAEIEKNLDFLSSDLRDLPARHRSIRAVVGQSLELLSQEERQLAEQLSVFRGSFSRDASLEITGASLPQLVNLFDKSLLKQHSSQRFEMHPLIRQFVESQLAEDSKRWKQVRDGHATHYLLFLSKNSDQVARQGHDKLLGSFRLDLDNIRSAWSWVCERKRWDLVNASMDGFSRLLHLLSHYEEGEASMTLALDSQDTAENNLMAARLRSRRSRFSIGLGRLDQAQEDLKHSLSFTREQECPKETAFSLSQLSSVSYLLGDFELSTKQLSESLSLYRQASDLPGVADCLTKLGRIYGTQGAYPESKQSLQEGLQIFRDLGDLDGLARCLSNLGNVAILSKGFVEARRLYQEAFEVFEKLDDRKGMALTLSNLGLVFDELKLHQRALRLSEHGLQLFREIGDLDGQLRGMENLSRVTFELSDYEESKAILKEGLQMCRECGAVPVALIMLVGVARLWILERQLNEAARILLYVKSHPSSNEEAESGAEKLLADIESADPALDWTALRQEAASFQFHDLITDTLIGLK